MQHVLYLNAAIVNICALLHGLCAKFRCCLLIINLQYRILFLYIVGHGLRQFSLFCVACQFLFM